MSNFKFHNLVVIDTNFIFLPYQFKVDYLNEIYLNLEGKTRFYIFKQSLNEINLKMYREPGGRKLHKFFKSGMRYLEKNEKVYPIYFIDEIKDENETTDDFLLKWCLIFKKECKHIFLATNDADLRRKAKRSSVNVIYLRQKRFLTIERV